MLRFVVVVRLLTTISNIRSNQHQRYHYSHACTCDNFRFNQQLDTVPHQQKVCTFSEDLKTAAFVFSFAFAFAILLRGQQTVVVRSALSVLNRGVTENISSVLNITGTRFKELDATATALIAGKSLEDRGVGVAGVGGFKYPNSWNISYNIACGQSIFRSRYA